MARAKSRTRAIARAFRSGLSARVSLTVLCVLMASSSEAKSQPAGEPARGTDATPWRLELAALGGWLPGDGPRGGAGLGIGAEYDAFSFGGEVWRYRLNLQDGRTGERLRFSSTAVMPVVLGLAYEPDGSSLRLRLSGGIGFISGPEVEVATCTTVLYAGGIYSLRGSLRWVSGKVALGPHIGWAGVANRGGGDKCPIRLNGPDPKLKDYPTGLPVGLELGLGAVLGF